MHLRLMLSNFWLLGRLSGSVASFTDKLNEMEEPILFDLNKPPCGELYDGLSQPSSPSSSHLLSAAPVNNPNARDNEIEPTTVEIARVEKNKSPINPNIEMSTNPKPSNSRDTLVSSASSSEHSNATKDSEFGETDSLQRTAHQNPNRLTILASPHAVPLNQVTHRKIDTSDWEREGSNDRIDRKHKRITSQDTTSSSETEEQDSSQLSDVSRSLPSKPRPSSRTPTTFLKIEGNKLQEIQVIGDVMNGKYKILYACHELYGNSLLLELKLSAEQRKWAETLYLGNFKDYVQIHSIKSTVVYIDLMHRIYSPGLAKSPEGLKNLQIDAISNVKTSWDQIYNDELENIILDQDGIAHVQKFLDKSLSGYKPNNVISNFIFLSWLKKKFPTVHQLFSNLYNMNQPNNHFMAILSNTLFFLVGEKNLETAIEKNLNLANFLGDARLSTAKVGSQSSSLPQLIPTKRTTQKWQPTHKLRAHERIQRKIKKKKKDRLVIYK